VDQVLLSNSGLHVSRLCLGMMSYYSGTPSRPWMLDEKAAEPILRRAVEGGITFFDTGLPWCSSHSGSRATASVGWSGLARSARRIRITVRLMARVSRAIPAATRNPRENPVAMAWR
jgi:predicted aldo/keto reductase-like oxidoreductase